MGRKIDMKKIEDVTRCQVTFSKRRSSLMKKANELAVCCDVDVAFVAFSPSGRVSKFCNQKRIEDVLHRYVDLPADKRFIHISNVQEKVEKLQQLSHINGDTSKLQYLDKQIENLELQIKKSGLELQILETDLRDYELGPEQDPSLHQLSWCERNLKLSLQKVIARKNALADISSMTHKQSNFEMERGNGVTFPSNFNENEEIRNPFTGQILMQLDPWISPYSAQVRESIFQDIFDQAKYTTNEKLDPSNVLNLSQMCNFPILDSQNNLEAEIILTPYSQIPSSSSHIPKEQPLMVDQSLLNSQHLQMNVDAWNNNNTSSVYFSDAIYKSSQSYCNIPGPRFTSTTTITTNAGSVEMPVSLYDGMGGGLEFLNLNSNRLNGREIGQLDMDNYYYNNISFNDNIEMLQSQAPFYVPPPMEVSRQDTNFDHSLPEDALGDDAVWTSKIQKSSLWEWDDLLLDENLNLQDIFSEKIMAIASQLTILAPKPRTPQAFKPAAAAACSCVNSTPVGTACTFKRRLVGAAAGLLAAAAVVAAGPPAADATRIEYFATFAEPSCELNFVRSGLGYCDVVVGSGEEVPFAELINVHYTARFADGIVFDSTFKRARPLTMRLGMGKVIKGLDQGILGGGGVPPMKVGGKRKLHIPPQLAYGPEPAGCFSGDCNIPANATLLYDVNFVNVYSGNRKQ